MPGRDEEEDSYSRRLGKLAAGMTVEAAADEYGLTREDVLAALIYAASTVGADEVRALR